MSRNAGIARDLRWLRMAALFVGLIAVALLAVSVWPPARYIAEPTYRWISYSFAISAALLALSLWRCAPEFGVLSSALVAGSAAQLFLTEPLLFPVVRMRPATSADALMLAVLGMEAAVVGWSLFRRKAFAAMPGVVSRLGGFRLLAFAAVSAFLCVSLLGYVGNEQWVSYLKQVLVGGLLIGLQLMALLALMKASPPFRIPQLETPILPLFVAVAGSALLAWYAFERMPHVEDELVYLFQAHTYASGALTVPAPPQAAQPGLEYYMLKIADGRWYGVTAPGWPMVLAIGVLLGVPWLINPLLAGVSVLLVFHIGRQLSDRKTAALAALLLATSPWFLAASGSLMTHTLVIALSLAAWAALLRSKQGAGGGWTLMAGLAMGWVFTTRQMDGVVLGGLTGLWLLLQRRSLRLTALYGIGCVITGAVYLAYNAAFTANPLESPLAQYLAEQWGPRANAYGFGPDIGPPGTWGVLDPIRGHSVHEGLLNTAHNLSGLQFELFGWTTGSLSLVLAFVIWGRKQRLDVAMLIAVAAVAAAMFGYWFAGGFYIGPRYWFAALVPLVYLTVRGVQEAAHRLGPGESALPANACWVMCLVGLLVFLPWRGVAKYHHYERFHATIRDDRARGIFGDSVVLVKDRGDIASALMLNDPRLRPGSPIFLADVPKLDEEDLRKAFPGRAIIRYSPVW